VDFSGDGGRFPGIILEVVRANRKGGNIRLQHRRQARNDVVPVCIRIERKLWIA
jgi:hypothetical protein